MEKKSGFLYTSFVLLITIIMAMFVANLQNSLKEGTTKPYVEEFLERTSEKLQMTGLFAGEDGGENDSPGNDITEDQRMNDDRPDTSEDAQSAEKPAEAALPAASETQEAASENAALYRELDIRVLLTGEQGYVHQQFSILFDKEYYIQNGQEVYYGEGGAVLTESDIENLFARQNQMQENVPSSLVIGVWTEEGWNKLADWQLTMDSEERMEKYQGILVITKAPDDTGYYLVNTLPLETYLYYVLPSEMPSAFPLEALKAQAVCARSYAMLQISQGRLEEYGADVDDTTAFQVYHAQEISEAAVRAVDETAGKYLCFQGKPIEAFYYACSCGHSTTAEIWRNSENRDYSYLTYRDYGTLEAESPWYRWKYFAADFNLEALKSRLLEQLSVSPESLAVMEDGQDDKLYEITDTEKMRNIIEQMNEIQTIEVTERLTGNVANKLHIISGRYHIIVEGEYYIRKTLTAEEYQLTKQDGSVSDQLSMVPSGFFELQTVKESGRVAGFVLQGGGFGHGAGLSQYGAKYLAEAGKDYQYILTYYYENVTIETL